MYQTIIIIVSALLMSAFFSAMEIAYLAANRLRVELDRKQSGVYNYIVGVFLKYPGQYISTILVGNNIALVVYSLFMSSLISMVLDSQNYVVDTLISTVIIIFVAEYIPKAVVKVNPNLYLHNFSIPIYIFFILFYPIAKFSTLLSALILRMFGLKLKGEPRIVGFDKVDLANLVETANDGKNDNPNENEIKIFQNALDFSDLRVRDCMLPRIDVEATDINASIEELREQFIRSNYSRLLVYENSIDNIIGYVNSRQLFDSPTSIGQILRQIIYVPESAPVQRLLGQFIKSHKSMAVVIDEFGGTAGIITIEDILEEIFGEIEDEHDTEYMVEKRVGDNEYIFSGRLEVEHLNTEYGLDIPVSDQYDTLAGFVLYLSEDIPQNGEVIEHNRFRIEILRSSGSKIRLLKLKVITA